MTLVGHEHVIECVLWVPDKFSSTITGQDIAKDNNDVVTAAKRSARLNGSEFEQQSSQPQTPSAVLISASRDRSIKFWDVYSGSCLFTLFGHDNWVRGIRLHPNGKMLLSVSDDKTMRIWSIEHRRCTKVLQAHPQFVTSIGTFL